MEESEVVSGILARPEFIALVVLIIGAILARLASLAVGHGLNALDRHTARITTSDSSVLAPRLIGIVRALVFWLMLILAAAVALQVLSVGNLSSFLDVVTNFVPAVLVGFMIIVSGHLLGLLSGHLLARFSDTLAADSLAPRLLHGTILTVAIVMGLQQIGIDITIVTQILLIAVTTTGAGLVLAFALGARSHVASLMAYRELARLAVGERICIDDIEGTIVEIRTTGVDISTGDGIATIPASRFAETTVLRRTADATDE